MLNAYFEQFCIATAHIWSSQRASFYAQYARLCSLMLSFTAEFGFLRLVAIILPLVTPDVFTASWGEIKNMILLVIFFDANRQHQWSLSLHNSCHPLDTQCNWWLDNLVPRGRFETSCWNAQWPLKALTFLKIHREGRDAGEPTGISFLANNLWIVTGVRLPAPMQTTPS